MVAIAQSLLSRSVTERARKAAVVAGLGAWESSLRVNGSIDRDALINGAIVLFIAPCLPIATGLFPPEGPWWIRAFCIAVGVIFLFAGLVLFPLAWRRRQAGPALIHLFGNGAVLERTKGQIFALPYAETPVDHVRWKEGIDGGEPIQARQHLWITLPDSRIVMLDGWGEEELQDLSFIAERWGLSPQPRLLEESPKAHPPW